jgi:alpha-D-xyloside xylohydrolase
VDDAEITVSTKGTKISSGSLSATIHPDQHTFDIRFHATDGSKQLTSLLNRSVGFAYGPAPSSPLQLDDMRNFDHYIFTQTTLGVGETVHGLGERFGAFNKVGQSVSLWNADGGTSSDQAYKNVSFWLSGRGYGVFIDTPDHVELEIGSERSCRVQTSVKGQRLKWYLIYGPSPKEVLYKYTILTGRAGRVPSWSFGLWLSTSFTTSYDEKTVSSFLEGMKSRDIPVEVFHYDCFWLKAFHWCDFVFDTEMFPDPKGMINRIKASGLVKKVCVWTNPYLGQASPVFKMAAEKGYLLKRKNGDVWQTDLWQAGMGLIDFTNPEAAKCNSLVQELIPLKPILEREFRQAMSNGMMKPWTRQGCIITIRSSTTRLFMRLCKSNMARMKQFSLRDLQLLAHNASHYSGVVTVNQPPRQWQNRFVEVYLLAYVAFPFGAWISVDSKATHLLGFINAGLLSDC